MQTTDSVAYVLGLERDPQQVDDLRQVEQSEETSEPGGYFQ